MQLPITFGATIVLGEMGTLRPVMVNSWLCGPTVALLMLLTGLYYTSRDECLVLQRDISRCDHGATRGQGGIFT